MLYWMKLPDHADTFWIDTRWFWIQMAHVRYVGSDKSSLSFYCQIRSYSHWRQCPDIDLSVFLSDSENNEKLLDPAVTDFDLWHWHWRNWLASVRQERLCIYTVLQTGRTVINLTSVSPSSSILLLLPGFHLNLSWQKNSWGFQTFMISLYLNVTCQ